MNQSTQINPTISIVFFGNAHAGKSTLVGYLIDQLRHDVDAEEINRKVKSQIFTQYRSDSYYAYIVDNSMDERMRDTEHSGLGTSKFLHTGRVSNIQIDDNRQSDIVLFDTPGSTGHYRERLKGMSYGELGVFVIEVGKLVDLLEDDEHHLRYAVEFIVPLKTWLSISPDVEPIILISKCDLYEGDLNHLVAELDKYIKNALKISDISPLIIPAEICIPQKSSQNIFAKEGDKYMGFSGGCLWEQLLGSIRKTLRVKLNHCSEEPGLLAIDRVVNVRGLGDVIEGKVIRGSFNVSQKVKLVPNLEPSGHINNKVPIGKISSIKQIMGEQLNEALEGDMIGIRISGFGITKLPRGAVLIAEDTPFVQGRNLSLLVQAEAAKEMALGSHYGVNWFGKVIWCQLTKLEGNKASLVIEGGQGTSALFVSPLDKGNLQFDSLTFFNSGSSTMISATLISID